jgi:uncharacterized membrane protein YcaP (DUF421 family)
VGKRPITPFDLPRMLLGGQPATFLLEAVLRLLVLYLTLILAFRLMGRRMSSQLTRNELIALVSLAAAVGPALQDPEQGLLPPIVVALLVTGIQRGLAVLSVRSHRFEHVAQGGVAVLVEDGRIRRNALRENQVSRERLFAELRREGVQNLGSLDRVYFEPNGTFSILRASERRAGLSLVPEWDIDLAEEEAQGSEQCACGECGAVVPKIAGKDPCAECGGRSFRAAVTPAS